ncbi:MAG: glycosyltransferase family 39 protein [Planctomycetia bacterium]|nr:glycosyltransferase family 39 protein [Planctomycetia bacterium]
MAGLALLGLVALQLALGDSWYLFHRQFWVDEIYTDTIVADPSFRHSMQALAGGVDVHPPAPYLVLRGFTRLLGCHCEGAYRLYSLGWLLLGMLGVYVCLRHTFGRAASAAAVLVLWCHTELLYYAFEARGYAPWFAASVWFAYCLSRCRFADTTARHYLALGLSAAWLCSLHYLAILCWGLASLGECWVDRERRLWRWPVLLAASCGPLALLASAPFLFGQRAALTVPTWIPPPDWGNLLYFTSSLVPLYFAGILLGLCAAGRLTGRPAAATPQARSGLGLIGLASLALLPAVLVAASFLWQPMHHPRYALPALAAFAPLLAWALARFPPTTALACAAAVTVLGTLALHDRARATRTQDRAVDEFIASVRARAGAAPVVFEMSVELLVVHRYAPDLAARCFFLDFDDGPARAVRHPAMICSRDVARAYARYYGSPALLSWNELRGRSSFVLVSEFQNWQQELLEPQRFPGFTPRRLDRALHEMTSSAREPGP